MLQELKEYVVGLSVIATVLAGCAAVFVMTGYTVDVLFLNGDKSTLGRLGIGIVSFSVLLVSLALAEEVAVPLLKRWVNK